MKNACAYCGGLAEGNFAIHRDGFGKGPEVHLCDFHGKYEKPTESEIWAAIRKRIGSETRCERCDEYAVTCRFHSTCEREHHPEDLAIARTLLNAVLRGEDILTDKKWLKRCKVFLGDYGP